MGVRTVKKTAKRVSLDDFAKARRATFTNVCVICSLPKTLRDDVEAGIKKGTSSPLIAEWLKSQGVKIGETSVKRHRRNHVEAPLS